MHEVTADDVDLPAIGVEGRSIHLLAYSLSEFKLTPIGANGAMLGYRAWTSFPSINARSPVLKLAVGDVWVKRGERWESRRYQETETKQLGAVNNFGL